MEENVVISNIKGGFGNQLFQYATGLAVSIRTNSKLQLDLSFFDVPQYKAALKLDMLSIEYKIASESDITKLRNEIGVAPFYYSFLSKLNINNKFKKRSHVIDSSGFRPSKKLFDLKPPVYIEGWCVKEVYFHEIKSILKNLFLPKEKFTDLALIHLEEIMNTNSVSIHVRRGDYVNNPVFEVLPLEYYLSGIEKIMKFIENPVFFVFSDDIEWCKQNFQTDINFCFVDLNADSSYTGQCDIEDFFLMKNCKHNITANSSYSWWAAYLNENPNPIIISPLKWYKSRFYQKSLDKYSFIPENWIRI